MYGSYLVPAPIWFLAPIWFQNCAFLVPLSAYLVPLRLFGSLPAHRPSGSYLVPAPIWFLPRGTRSFFQSGLSPFSSDSRPVLYLYPQPTALNCARNSCNLTNLHREPSRSSTAPIRFLAIFAARSLSWRFSLPFRGQYG